MNQERVAFVGGGRVVRIILGGWKRSGSWPQSVAVLDPNAAVTSQLLSDFPNVRACESAAALGRGITVVFLAVHPPQLLPALEELSSGLAEGTLVVSLSPKITISQLAALLPARHPCCRVIPNAPSVVTKGFNPVAFGDHWNDADRSRLQQLLLPLGEAPEVPEEHLEAYPILTAMGPTYFWFQWQLLEELGTEFGLPADGVRRGIQAMLRGAIDTYFESGLTPNDTEDLIPVHPLRDQVAEISQAYRSALPLLFHKIRPQVT